MRDFFPFDFFLGSCYLKCWGMQQRISSQVHSHNSTLVYWLVKCKWKMNRSLKACEFLSTFECLKHFRMSEGSRRSCAGHIHIIHRFPADRISKLPEAHIMLPKLMRFFFCFQSCGLSPSSSAFDIVQSKEAYRQLSLRTIWLDILVSQRRIGQKWIRWEENIVDSEEVYANTGIGTIPIPANINSVWMLCRRGAFQLNSLWSCRNLYSSIFEVTNEAWFQKEN